MLCAGRVLHSSWPLRSADWGSGTARLRTSSRYGSESKIDAVLCTGHQALATIEHRISLCASSNAALGTPQQDAGQAGKATVRPSAYYEQDEAGRTGYGNVHQRLCYAPSLTGQEHDGPKEILEYDGALVVVACLLPES